MASLADSTHKHKIMTNDELKTKARELSAATYDVFKDEESFPTAAETWQFFLTTGREDENFALEPMPTEFPQLYAAELGQLRARRGSQTEQPANRK